MNEENNEQFITPQQAPREAINTPPAVRANRANNNLPLNIDGRARRTIIFSPLSPPSPEFIFQTPPRRPNINLPVRPNAGINVLIHLLEEMPTPLVPSPAPSLDLDLQSDDESRSISGSDSGYTSESDSSDENTAGQNLIKTPSAKRKRLSR